MLEYLKENFFSYECLCCGCSLGKSTELFCEFCSEYLFKDAPVCDDGIISPLNYNSLPARSLILAMKDYKIKEAFHFSAKILADKIKRMNIPELDTYYIAFAPRNLRALFKKGFDQSYEIGKYLSYELFGTTKRCKILFRSSIFSKEQKHLDSEERRENANKHIKLLPFIKVPEKIILLDDVSTTGSTLFAMRRLALKKGAERCLLCTVARQVSPSTKYRRC